MIDEVNNQKSGCLSSSLDAMTQSAIDPVRSNPLFYKLFAIDGREGPGYCGLLYSNLRINDDDVAIRKILCDEWRWFNEMARINICYAASNARAMSVETAVQLFHHSSSDTHERHLIVAGLASSEHQRHMGEQLFELAAHIGKYHDNPNRQRTLDNFLRSLERLRKQNAKALAHAS